jgi:predicted O-methyltransferase YrrM
MTDEEHDRAVARAQAELAAARTDLDAWTRHHNLFNFQPIDESRVEPQVRRYRAAHNYETARRNFLLAQRDFQLAGGTFMNWTVSLDDAHLASARIVPSRIALLDRLPKNAVVAEVGTEFGKFTEHIVARTQPRELHLIDMNLANFQRDRIREAIDRGIVTFHEGDSSTILATFAPATFDWIYLDADHFYAGIKKDIAAARERVKPEGFLVFNDYTMWSPLESIAYGVPAAVHELAIEHDWEFAYLALEARGYYDVALRRIAGR